VYAVIKTGGKQERVVEGQRLRVERLGRAVGEVVELEPVLVVDGGRVLAKPGELAGTTVSLRVVGEELGPKIRGFTYKPKSNNRRRFGHRQHYDTVEVTGIRVP
jgi:large subunit ribosomal protein L21